MPLMNPAIAMTLSRLTRALPSALAIALSSQLAMAQNCPTGGGNLLLQLPDYQNGFTSDLGCEGCGGDGQGVAEAVVFDEPTAVDDVTIWGIFQGTSTPTNDFTFIVHAHDPVTGLPAEPIAPLYSESGIAAIITATGVNTPPPLVPAAEYQITMTPGAPLNLPAGTYWFEIWCDSGSGTDDFGWLTGTTDTQHGLPQASIAFECPSTDFFTLGLDMAMVVCGGPAPAPLAVFCAGDGSASACPCGNQGGAGQGCANSSGAGAELSSSGSMSVASDDLGLHATSLLPSQPALAFSGENQVAGGAGAPFGDGLRCAGTNVLRLGVRTPDLAGEADWGPGLAGQAGYLPGDLRHFQVWYRDPSGSPCGAGFNLTNGLSGSFAP